jgi:hypothetical protein
VEEADILKEEHMWVPICKVDGCGIVAHNQSVGAQSNGSYPKFSDFHDVDHLH